MGQILRNWRITLAALFSVMAIAGVYLFVRGVQLPTFAEASAESALLQAIATKDSDGDGLADWEEALYGTDSHTTDTFQLGLSDGEAVAKGLIVPKAIADIAVATSSPAADSDIDYAASGLTAPTEGTLTDAFAKNFFTLYLAAKQVSGGTDLTDVETNVLVGQAMGQFLQNLAPAADLKTVADIKISGTGPDALRAYAAAVEAIIATYDPHVLGNQLQYLQNYVDKGDQSALDSLRAIAASFRNTAVGLTAITVPSEMVAIHLALVNALARMGGEISDFSRVGEDPLATMFALSQHPQTIIKLAKTFTDIANEFAIRGVILAPGTEGAAFVNLMSPINASSSLQMP